MSKPIVIVFGNAKGGTGKSTLSVHVFVRLAMLGFDIAAIDCDVNQGTVSRYLLNRANNLSGAPSGECTLLSRSMLKDYDFSSLSNLKSEIDVNRQNIDIYNKDSNNCKEFLNILEKYSDKQIIVIDTPGSIDPLFLEAHSRANVVITPVNDSLIDLDLIGDFVNNSLRLGVYSEVLWEAKKIKAQRGLGDMDWIVVKNRVSGVKSNNNEKISELLNDLSKKLGFSIAPGMFERVIFRELFRDGKTVFDSGMTNNLSYVVARSEVDSIVQMIFNLVKKRNLL